MKLAAIASEESLLPILEAARNCDEIQLESLWTPNDSLESQLGDLFTDLNILEDWSVILSDSTIEAVVVAGSSAPVVTAARQIIQLEKRLLIATMSTNPISVFEYTALWQEFPDKIHPLFFSGIGAVVEHIIHQFPNEDLGRLWRVEFVRCAGVGSLGRLDFSEINSWLLQDLSWLRRLEPAAAQVTMATSEMGDSEHPVEARVTLTGENATELRWTIVAEDQDRWTLEFIGENGRCVVSLNSEGTLESIEFKLTEGSFPLATIENDLAVQLEDISRGTSRSNWSDVIKLGEIGAAAERSLKKKRTMTVQFEEASERSQFKTQMAAMGCGALMWTMFGAIALLIIGSFIDPRDREYLTSKSAGYVLMTDDFDVKTGLLKESADPKVKSIARGWSSTSPVLIIEADPADSSIALARRTDVIDNLNSKDVRDVEERIVVRPLPGQWFETAMLIGWVIVFLPIGIVLVAQAFIVVARPLE